MSYWGTTFLKVDVSPEKYKKSHSTEADVVKLKIRILLVIFWTPKIYALGKVSSKI